MASPSTCLQSCLPPDAFMLLYASLCFVPGLYKEHSIIGITYHLILVQG